MTVFVELAVPSEALSVGRLLSPGETIRVELARAVPVNTNVRCLWLIGEERKVAADRLHTESTVSVREIDSLADRTLVRLDDLPDEEGFMALAHDAGGVMLDAVGENDEWTIQLRLPDHDALSTLSADCEANDISVRLQQRYELRSRDRTAEYGLSDQQRETILEAYRRGYFGVPRNASLSELAAGFGVSDQAVSERLRRGLSALLSRTVLSDRSDPSDPL